jgi:hypothetical protein
MGTWVPMPLNNSRTIAELDIQSPSDRLQFVANRAGVRISAEADIAGIGVA